MAMVNPDKPARPVAKRHPESIGSQEVILAAMVCSLSPWLFHVA